jgi:amino acid adenylation domain-containing protein
VTDDVTRRLSRLSREERALLFEKLRERREQAAPPDLGIERLDRSPGGPGASPPPLSFAQQRLWFLERLAPGNVAYHVPAAVAISGDLDPAALRRALAAVVARHESLRTTFGQVEGQPVQIVAPDLRVELPIVDLSGLETLESEHSRLGRDEVARPFDLGAGPLLRAVLLRRAPGQHTLLLTLHHIVSDGWSMGVLIREIGALYSGERELPELPIQYADFAVWQREWLSGEVLEGQLAVWRRRLAGAPPALELPTDRPRPAVRGTAGGFRPIRLDEAVGGRLKELAREERATPFLVVLAAFLVLLQRWTGQEDLCVGTPVANRNRAEVKDLIGFFVNTLVLRGNLSGDPSFRGLLGRLREVALEAYAHQDLPFERLVEELKPERDPARTPLFQALCSLQNAPMPALRLGGLVLTPLEPEAAPAKFELSLSLEEAGEAFVGSLGFSTDLFDGTTAARMVRHFESLAAAGIAGVGPDRPLSELPLLSEEESAQLLREWNDAPDPPDLDAAGLVHERFARRAALHPERPAVVCGDLRLTYGELADRAARLAGHLRSLGVGPEVRVALRVERSVEMVIGLLAVLGAGGAYVPLDPKLPEERLAHLFERSGAAVLLTRERIASAPEAPGAFSRVEPENPENPENAAYVIFTSGSTGEPKGVVVEHRQLRHYVRAVEDRLRLPDGASFAMVSTFAADLGNTALFPALCGGGCLELVPPGASLDPEAFADWAEGRRIDALKIVPSHLAALLQGSRPESVLPRELLVLGGEAAPPELIARVAELAPRCRILNHYGPTEATVGAATWSVSPGPRQPPLGRPLAGVRAHVLDRRMHPVPAGVAGELCLAGAGLARGYLGRPDLTAERFVPDPFGSLSGPGGRLYRTGDLARRLPEGALDFLGRVDHQIKVRGFRVEPGEIEAALGRHPEVRECAVGVRRGPTGDVLVAYVVGPQDPGTLRSWLARSLPGWMVPASWVVLDALPLNSNGKLDREALSRIAISTNREEMGADFVPPRTETEREVAAIWAEVLGLTRVGIHDNFFDLGGHSLLLPRVQLSLRQRLGRELPLLKLFEHPTVGALAESLEGGGEAFPGTEESRGRAERQRQGLELQRQRMAARRAS